MALQTKEFSASVPLEDGSNTFTYILRITENSINETDNTSDITIQAIVKQEKNEPCFSNTSVGVSFNLGNGCQESNYQPRSLQGSGEHLYYTWHITVPHESDGSAILLVSGQFWVGSNQITIPTIQIQQSTMMLTSIPSGTKVGASDAVVGSASIIVLTTISPAFTCSVKYAFGDLTGYIGADGSILQAEEKFTPCVISFYVPEIFYSQMPGKEKRCELQITVYNGQKIVSTVRPYFQVVADSTLCRPLLTAQVTDTNHRTVELTGDENTLVRYASNALCQVQAQPQKWANIKETTVNALALEESLSIPETETDTYQFATTDSRGYTANLTVKKPWIPYSLVTCNPTARRTAPTTGQAELTVTGSCWKGNFGAAENALTIRYRQLGGEWTEADVSIGEDHTYTASFLLEGLDYDKAHLIEVESRDLLNTATATAIVQRGVPIFDWGEDYFNFHVPVHFGAGTTGLT